MYRAVLREMSEINLMRFLLTFPLKTSNYAALKLSSLPFVASKEERKAFCVISRKFNLCQPDVTAHFCRV